MDKLYVDIDALTEKFNKKLNDSVGRLKDFVKDADNIGGKLEKVGSTLSVVLSAPLALLAKKSVEAYGELEALWMSLKTIEGSVTNTARRLNELNEVAKLPGIGFKEAIQGDVRLRAVGISADIAKRSMMAFGNAIATAGGGKAQFDSVIYQLTQMSAKSKVLSQDFRPIIEAVPAVAQAVQKLYGTVDTEVIQEKMAKARINSQQFIEQIIAELEKLPSVTGGVKNAIENFADTTFKAFAKVGETIDKNVGVQKWIEKVGVALEEAAEGFYKLSPEAQKAILILAGAAIIVPPFLALAGTVLPAITTGLAAIATPAGAAGVALVAAATYAVTHWNEVEGAISKVRRELTRVSTLFDAGIYSMLGDKEGLARTMGHQIQENAKNRKKSESVVDTEAYGDQYGIREVKPKITSNALVGDPKELAKQAKAFADLRDRIYQETSRAQVEAMDNEYQQKKANHQLQFNEEVRGFQKSIGELKSSNEQKKVLTEAYTQWYSQRYKQLQKELSDVRLFSDFKSLKNIKLIEEKDTKKRAAAIYGISPEGVEKFAISLKQKFDTGIKQLINQSETKQKTTSLEHFLGLAEGTINGDNFRQYAEQANVMIDANQRIKDSFKNMSADALASLSIVVGEMITGTATIQDLANTLLSSLSQMLAQIAKQNILLGIFSLNAGMIAKGVLAGIGAGITGGLAKRTQQRTTDNYTSPSINYGGASVYAYQNRQSSNYQSESILRGSDVYWSSNRYNEIKRY